MSEPDSTRLATFFGALIALVALFVALSRVLEVRMVSFGAAYMFTPFVAGMIVCLWRGVPLTDAGLRVGRPRWLAASILVGLPLIGLTLAIALAVPGVGFDGSVDPLPGVPIPDGPVGILAMGAIAIAIGATVNAVFALGEEFGWRGYLLWELAPLGFWKASVAIGTVWGLWHAPLIVEGYNYPSFPIVGVAAMAVACVAFSPVYTYLVIRAESVLAAAFIHGVFNSSAGIVLVYTATDSAALADLVASPVGLAGVVAFGLAAAVIALRGTPSLERPLGGVSGGDGDAGSETDATQEPTVG